MQQSTSLNNALLQPCSDTAAWNNYKKTISSGVPLSTFEQFINSEQGAELKFHYPEGQCHIWGLAPGKGVVIPQRWELIQPGDIVFFYRKQEFFAKAKVTCKLRSAALAEFLWKKKVQDPTFEYIYFVTPPESIQVPVKVYNEVIKPSDSAKANNPVRSFTVLDASQATQLLTAAGPASNTVYYTDAKEVTQDPQGTAKILTPLNQILYGPPGTGKTYHTVARAVGLLEGIKDEELEAKYPPEKRKELRAKFEDYRAAGRIAFVTFHQAFTYEDFVEGIKPILPKEEATDRSKGGPEDEASASTETVALQYTIRKGIFRTICDAAASIVPIEKAVAITSVPFDELYAGFLSQLEGRIKSTDGPVIFQTKKGHGVQLTSVDKEQGRLIFQYGKGRQVSPELPLNNGGTSGQVDKFRQQKLHQLYASIDEIKNLKRDVTSEVGGSADTLQWVAFNELKKYEAKRLAQQQEKLQTKPNPPFVLIIDEINRGNVANIFGELITLLEDDKRAGLPEAATVTLPYSQEEFSVPQNLYLLGTMNTADRSVEALDSALRRRFNFTEMLPRPDLLSSDVEGVNLQQLLTAINARLEQLLDHDHCIGHALLMRVTTLDGLREAFRRNILPLLQEYFFGDWGKIGLVLGGSFIQQVNKKQSESHYKLLPFEKYSAAEFSEKAVYKLANIQQLPAAAFQSIYA